MTLPTQRILISMGAVLLVVFLLGARLLRDDVLFVDEYWSVYKSGTPPYGPVAPEEILYRIVTVDPGGMGALYYFSLGAWGSLMGGTPFAVRAYSLMYGILAVALMFRCGAALFGKWQIGLYSAVALGFSAFFVDYLHEARAYTQVAFFTVLSLWAYWRVRYDARLERLLLLIVAVAGLAYSHYVALAVGAVLGGYHLLTFQRKRAWWLVLGALLVAGACYVPWLGVAFEVVGRGASISRASTSMTWEQILPELLTAFANANLALWAWVMWWTLKTRINRVGFLWVGLGVALALVMVLNALIPFMVHLRYLLFLFPFLALLWAVGVARYSQENRGGWAIVLIWAVVGVGQSLNPAFTASWFGQIYRAPALGIEQAQALLRTYSHPSDAVLFHIMPPRYEPFGQFVVGYLIEGIPHAHVDQYELMNLSLAGSDNEYLQAVNQVLVNHEAVWGVVVPEVAQTNKSGVVNYVLNSQYRTCDTLLNQENVRLSLYMRPPTEQNTQTALFGESLQATVRRIDAAPDSLRVVLWWDLEGVPQGVYSVGVHLRDEQGQVVRQVDVGLADYRPSACQTLTLALDDLPIQAYEAVLVVYDWRTGERLLRENDDSWQIWQSR